MAEQDHAPAQSPHEAGPEAGPDERRSAEVDVPTTPDATDRRDRAWAQSLWLSVLRRRDTGPRPRSARA